MMQTTAERDSIQPDYGEEAALGAAVEGLLAQLREEPDALGAMLEIEAYLARYGSGDGTGLARADASYRLLRGLAEHILLLDQELAETPAGSDDSTHQSSRQLQLTGTALLRRIVRVGMQEATSERDDDETWERWRELYGLFAVAEPAQESCWDRLLLSCCPGVRKLDDVRRDLAPLGLRQEVLDRLRETAFSTENPDPAVVALPGVVAEAVPRRSARRRYALGVLSAAAILFAVLFVTKPWKAPRDYADYDFHEPLPSSFNTPGQGSDDREFLRRPPEFVGRRVAQGVGKTPSPFLCPDPTLVRSIVEQDHGPLRLRWLGDEPIRFTAELGAARATATISAQNDERSCRPDIELRFWSGTHLEKDALREALRNALSRRLSPP
jgi:hypothetical protein